MGDWLDEATSGTSPHNPQVQRLIACAKDPLEFMKYVRTRDEADAGANAIKAFPYWKDYIRLYTQIWLNNKQILVPKSRRVLMSWTNVVLFLWEALFRVERRYAFVSKKESDADELLSRCEFIYDNLDWTQLPKSAFPVGKKTYCQFRFNDTNSEILGFPHGSDQLRQYGLSGILADEMAFWDYAEAMYSSAFPTIQGEGGKILGRFVGISSAAPGFFQRLVFDQLDQDASLLIDTDAVKRDFSVMRPMTGVEMWRNPKNNYVVYQIHYTADPANRNEQAKRTRMQGLSRDKYLQEHEISWETKHGKPVFPDFDANEHVVYETIKPVAGLPLLRGWDFGLCYGNYTEILTGAGWKRFADLSATDTVAAQNSQGHLIFERPKLLVRMPFKGELLRMHNRDVAATVTPDHIVPVVFKNGRTRRYYAKDLKTLSRTLKKKLYLQTCVPDALQSHSIGRVSARLLGWLFSEGSADGNRVTIYQTKSKTRRSLVRLLRKTPYAWHETPEGFRATAPDLADLLRACGSTQKTRRLPDVIKSATRAEIRAFLTAYTAGDGHLRTRSNKSREHTIYSASRAMIDDLAYLAMRLGWHTRIREMPSTRSWFARESRYIQSSGGWQVTFKKRRKRTSLDSLRFDVVPYDGTVYCASVREGKLFIREDGKSSWNGNTPACIICQYVEGQLRVLKEITAEGMGAERFSDLVLESCRLLYPAWADQRENWRDFIDPSGEFRKDTDEGTCAKILDSKGLACVAGPVAFEARKGAVEEFLLKRGALKISAPGCSLLLRGFKGGYRYDDKVFEVEPQKVRPIKDVHSHIQDAFQMVCSRVKLLITRKRDPIPSLNYGFQQGARAAGVLTRPKVIRT